MGTSSNRHNQNIALASKVLPTPNLLRCFLLRQEMTLSKQTAHGLSAEISLLSHRMLFTRSPALGPERILISWSAKSTVPLVQSVFKLTQSHHLSLRLVLLCLFSCETLALSGTFQSSPVSFTRCRVYWGQGSPLAQVINKKRL